MPPRIRSIRIAIALAMCSALVSLARADETLPPASFCAECGLFADPTPGTTVSSSYEPITGYDVRATAAEPAPVAPAEVASKPKQDMSAHR